MTQSVAAVAYSLDGTRLYSGSCGTFDGGCTEGEIAVWDIETGEQLKRVLAHREWVSGIEIDPNTGMIATSGKDGLVLLWDADLESSQELWGHEG